MAGSGQDLRGNRFRSISFVLFLLAVKQAIQPVDARGQCAVLRQDVMAR